MGNVKGVGVDSDAVALHDPVTVVVTPEGRDLDADTWSDANNYIAAGCAFKAGFPTYPGEDVQSEAPSPARPAPAQRAPQAPSSQAQPGTAPAPAATA